MAGMSQFPLASDLLGEIVLHLTAWRSPRAALAVTVTLLRKRQRLVFTSGDVRSSSCRHESNLVTLQVCAVPDQGEPVFGAKGRFKDGAKASDEESGVRGVEIDVFGGKSFDLGTNMHKRT
jgi:hypothetical protein